MKSNSSKQSDSLKNRLIYGFSGFFLMLGGMIWNEWSYGFVFLVISTVCLWEYYHLLSTHERKPQKFYGMAFGIILYILSFLISKGLISSSYYLLVYPFIFILFIDQLYTSGEKFPFERVSLTLLGIIYAMVPFSALHMAVFSEGRYSYQVILGIFFILWIHDIGAYFIGSKYGKRRLFARVSPNKTWEGSFGGGLLAALMAVLLSYYLSDLSLGQWLGLAAIIVIIGTHGDLIESLLKRSLQVKDSSKALPGHGGFLDRFDNLLFSAPFIAAFLKIF